MTTATATKRTANVNAVNITNNAEARAAVETLRHNRAEKRRIDAENKAAEATLREALGEKREFIVLGNVVARLSSLRKRTNIDAKTLALAFPEAYTATSSVTEFDFIETL